MARRPRNRPKSLWSPRYWGVWLFIALLRVLVLLPFRAQLSVGRALGRLMRLFARRRRIITSLNLQFCFPELDATARADLVRTHFEALGIAMLEVAMCWWGDAARLRPLVRVEGLEHLERARAQGKGVLLLSAHFTTLEIGGRLLGLFTPFHPMYRPNRNPVIESVMRGRREAQFERAISMHDVRLLLRTLKEGLPVWYAPDQGFLGKGRLMVPFFGVPAPTNPATSRIARASGAPVLPFFVHRLPGAQGYRLEFQPPLSDFPSDDVTADCLRINQLIEREVRKSPEQYLWAHNRFKTSAHRFPPKPHDPAVQHGLIPPGGRAE